MTPHMRKKNKVRGDRKMTERTGNQTSQNTVCSLLNHCKVIIKPCPTPPASETSGTWRPENHGQHRKSPLSKQVGLSFPMHIGRHGKKSCSQISAFLFLILLSYPLLPKLILLVFFFYYRSLSDEKQRKCTISTKKHRTKRLFR